MDRLEVLRYDTGKRSKVRMGIMPTETELTPGKNPTRTQAAHSKETDQIIESVYWKCFGENVGQLLIGLDKVQLNRTLFYVLFDEMVSDRYVFHSGVLNRVAGYGYG
nr:hypothetical protein [Tanacetum cinerariifolium]